MMKNTSASTQILTRKVLALATIAWLFLVTFSYANNTQVTNVLLTGRNTITGYSMVQFDIKWENSWRSAAGTANWDAAWIFVKYRVNASNGGDGLWKHATLSASASDHVAPAGSAISPSTDALGVFLYRSVDGTGTFSKTGVKLRWNYRQNFKTGTTPIDNADLVDIQVYAIEMVYIPSGPFTAGAPGTEMNGFTQANTPQFVNNRPVTITDPALTIQGNNPGSDVNTIAGRWDYGGFYYNWDLGNTTTIVLVSPTWPNGFNTFYCMKYEISQQEYVDFLNNLTSVQATRRFRNVTGNRYGITVTNSVYSTTNSYLPCNFLGWPDVAGYLDWSCLRPMTELEFEKACRGANVAAVGNEYAWGNATMQTLPYTLGNLNLSDEKIAINYSLTEGNAANVLTTALFPGPVRCGIFAGHPQNTGRVSSGSSYYGVMEMSGNVWEYAVSLGGIAGRSYTALPGNGLLTVGGDSDTDFWPGINGNGLRGVANTAYMGTTGITSFAGIGIRGGSWSYYISDALAVSARYHASLNSYDAGIDKGGRGVRGL